MWKCRSEEIDAARVRYTLERDSHPAAFAEVISAWRTDPGFRTLFNSLLADSPFLAFRWETPGVTHASVNKPFEFVLLNSPELDRRPDRLSFSEQFESASEDVVAFPNLGADATLIVPCPLAEDSAYVHLADFVRKAPERQRDALWRTVGDAMARRIGVRPVWLSTAGAGVAWLHVRLDDRPKYYGHAPYRNRT